MARLPLATKRHACQSGLGSLAFVDMADMSLEEKLAHLEAENATLREALAQAAKSKPVAR